MTIGSYYQSGFVFAVIEGMMRAMGVGVAALIGHATGSIETSILVALVAAGLQALGCIVSLRKSFRSEVIVPCAMRSRIRHFLPRTRREGIVGLLLGSIFLFQTCAGVYLFASPDADIGTSVLLRSLSIPLACALCIAVPYRQNISRKALGVLLFLVATWIMIGTPTVIPELLLSNWALLSIALAVGACASEILLGGGPIGVHQETHRVLLFASLWTLSLASALLAVTVGLGHGVLQLHWGLGVVAALSAGQLMLRAQAYNAGVSVVLKKSLTIGTYLVASFTVGGLLQGATFPPQGGIGVVMVVIAVSLISTSEMVRPLPIVAGRRSPMSAEVG